MLYEVITCRADVEGRRDSVEKIAPESTGQNQYGGDFTIQIKGGCGDQGRGSAEFVDVAKTGLPAATNLLKQLSYPRGKVVLPVRRVVGDSDAGLFERGEKTVTGNVGCGSLASAGIKAMEVFQKRASYNFV